MTTPAAGWYPDPAGSGRLRYWNGQAWTGHVSPPDPEPEPVVATPEPDPEPPTLTAPPVFAPVAAAPPVAPTQAPQAVGPGWQQPAVADRLGPDGQVLSGWWRRFFGYLIDAVLISIIAALVIGIYAAMTGGFGTLFNADAWSALLAKAEANPGYQPSQAEIEGLLGPGLLPLIGWVTVVSLFLNFLNGVVLVASSGQTVGDRVVGTRKVTAGRHIPGFGAAMLRWLIPVALSLLQVLPVIGIAALAVWVLDYLWPLWDQRRQALHDKAAQTYVERTALTGPVNR
ncbi:MAG: RDD family protein [Candidatus Nanopelagicales bacterium]